MYAVCPLIAVLEASYVAQGGLALGVRSSYLDLPGARITGMITMLSCYDIVFFFFIDCIYVSPNLNRMAKHSFFQCVMDSPPKMATQTQL